MAEYYWWRNQHPHIHLLYQLFSYWGKPFRQSNLAGPRYLFIEHWHEISQVTKYCCTFQSRFDCSHCCVYRLDSVFKFILGFNHLLDLQVRAMISAADLRFFGWCIKLFVAAYIILNKIQAPIVKITLENLKCFMLKLNVALSIESRRFVMVVSTARILQTHRC